MLVHQLTLIYQNGVYSLFYKEFKLDKNAICSTYMTTSKDMFHWQTAQKLAFTKTKQNILNRTIIAAPDKSTLYALMVIDLDKNEENNNSYFKLFIQQQSRQDMG